MLYDLIDFIKNLKMLFKQYCVSRFREKRR